MEATGISIGSHSPKHSSNEPWGSGTKNQYTHCLWKLKMCNESFEQGQEKIEFLWVWRFFSLFLFFLTDCLSAPRDGDWKVVFSVWRIRENLENPRILEDSQRVSRRSRTVWAWCSGRCGGRQSETGLPAGSGTAPLKYAELPLLWGTTQAWSPASRHSNLKGKNKIKRKWGLHFLESLV